MPTLVSFDERRQNVQAIVLRSTRLRVPQALDLGKGRLVVFTGSNRANGHFSNFPGVDCVVLRVSSNEAYENDLEIVADCDDESILVSRDVENDSPAFENAGGTVLTLEVGRRGPGCSLSFTMPGKEW